MHERSFFIDKSSFLSLLFSKHSYFQMFAYIEVETTLYFMDKKQKKKKGMEYTHAKKIFPYQLLVVGQLDIFHRLNLS